MAGKVGSRTRRTVRALIEDAEKTIALAAEVAADRDKPYRQSVLALQAAAVRCRLEIEAAGE